MSERKDNLTGNSYFSELTMYMRYHGLTEDQARKVLERQTHAARDAEFNEQLKKIQ